MGTVQHNDTAGFLGGFVLTIGKSLLFPELWETVVYASVGTVVSFIVSRLLKYWFGKK